MSLDAWVEVDAGEYGVAVALCAPGADVLPRFLGRHPQGPISQVLPAALCLRLGRGLGLHLRQQRPRLFILVHGVSVASRSPYYREFRWITRRDAVYC